MLHRIETGPLRMVVVLRCPCGKVLAAADPDRSSDKALADIIRFSHNGQYLEFHDSGLTIELCPQGGHHE
jgi:hypothetical protein